MRSLALRRTVPVLALSLALGCGGAPPPAAPGPEATAAKPTASAPTPAPAPVHVRLLAFNDFHGNLNPPTGYVPQVKGPVGGADYFAAHLKKLGAGKPDTAIVAAGDLVGASPLVSSLFHDEPTIDVMNEIGLTATALGNHELDKGLDELLRQQRGGCHPIDGCKLGSSFGGAKFTILGANVTSTKGKPPPLPAYVVRDVGGVKIAFVGMPLEDTPHSVVESGVAGLAFGDEVKTANALVPEIRAKGADTLVLLVHQGGEVKNASLNGCNDLSGPILGIAENLDKAYAAIVSGHTHQLYNCTVGGRPVTSALSFGRVITAIDLSVDPAKKTVVSAKAENFAVTHDVEPDPAVKAIVARAAAAAAVIENKPVGRITETLASHKSGGDSPLGSVIADAQLAATKKAGAKVALMNTSGIRADIVFPKSGDEKEGGIVTHGESFAAQPFANGIVTVTITGADLIAIFERELRDGGERSGLAVSEGLSVRYGTVGGKAGVVEMKLNGVAIDPRAPIRVTTNSFLADRDPALKAGKDRVEGPGDVEAFEAYLAAKKTVSPPKTRRVTRD